MIYDNIRDAEKPLTQAEFIAAVKEMLDDYAKAFPVGTNAFQDGKHMYHEWMNSFRGFTSF